MTRGGKSVCLGSFATAEEAALCVARTPEKQQAAAARRAAALTSDEARQQAQAEKLTLVVAENVTGYFGVTFWKPGHPKPYRAQVKRDGKQTHLGIFATAEEAALYVARSPEGQAASRKWTAAETEQLRELVGEHTDAGGYPRWANIAQGLPGRNAQESRCRWRAVTRKSRVRNSVRQSSAKRGGVEPDEAAHCVKRARSAGGLAAAVAAEEEGASKAEAEAEAAAEAEAEAEQNERALGALLGN